MSLAHGPRPGVMAPAHRAESAAAPRADLLQPLAAEAIGTALLLASVVGSGIMAERLAAGNAAIALLANAVATGASLFMLIVVFAPVSGAHFNPAVTLAFAIGRRIAPAAAASYVVAQVTGGIAGVAAAHAMFDLPLAQISVKARDGVGQVLSEALATFGLLVAIFGSMRQKPPVGAAVVALYIVGAYWFTASTSFANPAATIARALSDSFAGIAPASIPPFLAAQGAGALAAALLSAWLFTPKGPDGPPAGR